MKTITEEALLNALRWRYATKQFDPTRKIDPRTWAALEEALVLSPSSFGLQPWKFLVITDQATKEKLVSHAWGQRQFADASHVVIFTVQHSVSAAHVRRFMERVVSVQGGSVEALAGYEKVINGFIERMPSPQALKEWSARQLYIALGNFLTSAALLGVDTCPMEGLNPSGFDEVLGLTETEYATMAACPAGYRSPDCKQAARPKVRYDKKDIVVPHP